MSQNKKFDFGLVRKRLQDINVALKNEGDVPINEFCEILDQFCVMFAEMSSLLGVAFSDIKSKSTIIRGNNKAYPQHNSLFSMVKMEMDKGIANLNGENYSKDKAPKEFKNYNSTARNLLRMMWFFSFLRSTFEQIRDKPTETKLQAVLDQAYDTAFGEKHSWLVRKGAKLAISTGSDRKALVKSMIGVYDQERLRKENLLFLPELVPVHEALWDFYNKNNLTNLE